MCGRQRDAWRKPTVRRAPTDEWEQFCQLGQSHIRDVFKGEFGHNGAHAGPWTQLHVRAVATLGGCDHHILNRCAECNRGRALLLVE